MVCKELERYVPSGILREVVGCKGDAMLFLSCVQILTAVSNSPAAGSALQPSFAGATNAWPAGAKTEGAPRPAGAGGFAPVLSLLQRAGFSIIASYAMHGYSK